MILDFLFIIGVVIILFRFFIPAKAKEPEPLKQRLRGAAFGIIVGVVGIFAFVIYDVIRHPDRWHSQGETSSPHPKSVKPSPQPEHVQSQQDKQDDTISKATAYVVANRDISIGRNIIRKGTKLQVYSRDEFVMEVLVGKYYVRIPAYALDDE